MELIELQAQNLRCFTEFTITPILGVNLLLGENGAGKTSILEAIHILGYGRSFRGKIRDGIIQRGQNQLSIQARWKSQNHTQQAGLQHNGNQWQARVNAQAVDSLGAFCENFPVLSFDPNCHELIIGAADNRRRFVDWALFHVEPKFYPVWRRFNRALKQRNALLKTQPSAQELSPWDQEFAETGEAINQYRKEYLETLTPIIQNVITELLPECGELQIQHQPGWREPLNLLDSLRVYQDRDRQTGFCNNGPHRADWSPVFNQETESEHLSRGQAKLLALSALMAQALHFQEQKGFSPILCFDDLASELDFIHLSKMLSWLSRSEAQIWISGTENLPLYKSILPKVKMFHVEQGVVMEG